MHKIPILNLEGETNKYEFPILNLEGETNKYEFWTGNRGTRKRPKIRDAGENKP